MCSFTTDLKRECGQEFQRIANARYWGYECIYFLFDREYKGCWDQNMGGLHAHCRRLNQEQTTYVKRSSMWSWVAATPCMFDIYWRYIFANETKTAPSQAMFAHTVIDRMFSIRASLSRRVTSGSARTFAAHAGPRDSCKPTSWDLVLVSIFVRVGICWLRSSLTFWLLSQHVSPQSLLSLPLYRWFTQQR